MRAAWEDVLDRARRFPGRADPLAAGGRCPHSRRRRRRRGLLGHAGVHLARTRLPLALMSIVTPISERYKGISLAAAVS